MKLFLSSTYTDLVEECTAVERVIMASTSVRGTLLRLPQVYGPRDYRSRVPEYLEQMDAGSEYIVLEESLAIWRVSRGYVDNVADAIALAATDDRAAGRIYNLAEDDAISEGEFAESIGRAAGWTGRLRTLPLAELPEHVADHTGQFDYSHHLVTDTSRIRRDLGHREGVTRDAALRETVAWVRSVRPS